MALIKTINGISPAGMPAKKIKPLSPEPIASLKKSAGHYVGYRKWYEGEY
jgi:carbonic anhydrase/acetyltransferase-like protein (isoleucine patch superfamily)